MPWTFSHPAAVLPLRRYCPVPLDLSALVIGSMIPDLGYYLFYSKLASLAHSVRGSLLICLPLGLMLWGIFLLLRKPFCFVLPQPHRGALAPLAATPPSFRPRALITAGISVLLGAWTHIAWDSLTHNTWVVKQLPLLRDPVLQINNIEFPLYVVLQHLSTVAGAAILIAAYCSWLRLHRHSAISFSIVPGDRWRYFFLAAVVLLALFIAVPSAVRSASPFAGYQAMSVLVFRTAVDTTVAFSTLFTLSSLVLYATKRKGQAAR